MTSLVLGIDAILNIPFYCVHSFHLWVRKNLCSILSNTRQASIGRKYSVMKFAGNYIYGFICVLIYQAMFICNTSGPVSCKIVLYGFRFTNTFKWVPTYISAQISNSLENLAVYSGPFIVVLKRGRIETDNHGINASAGTLTRLVRCSIFFIAFSRCNLFAEELIRYSVSSITSSMVISISLCGYDFFKIVMNSGVSSSDLSR